VIPTRVRVLLLLSITAAGCGGNAEAVQPPATKRSEEIVIAADSPKLGAIGIDSVRMVRERVVSVLPAQVVLDENRTVRVFSPVSGRIRTLDAAAGDVVVAGAPLAHLVSADAAQAASDHLKADAIAAQTSAALARAEDLFAHHVIAQKELEQARSDAAQARAESARAAQRSAQLGDAAVDGPYILRAPLGGVVVERTANPGAEVRSDATAPLFTISSLESVWLTAAAPQRDLPYLHRGSHLVFTTDAAPGRRFEATVTWVSDQLDPATRTVTLRAELPNHDRALRALVVGDARLLASDNTAHAVVPSRALVTRGGETVVFVEHGKGHFERRLVKTGDDDGTFVVILEGLKVGERVVTTGSLLLASEAERQQ
jgi:cobalt-zinc-cadmium efflux system membrane fusion protein